MKIKHILLIGLLLLSTFNCSKKEQLKSNNEKKNVTSINSMPVKERFIPNDSIQALLDNALQKGDTLSYQKAYHYFSINHYKKEFLYYSITMADQYNYGQAYFDTYYFLKFLNHDSQISTDTSLINYYLLRAVETGNKQAKDITSRKYTDKGLKVPNSQSVLEK